MRSAYNLQEITGNANKREHGGDQVSSVPPYKLVKVFFLSEQLKGAIICSKKASKKKHLLLILTGLGLLASLGLLLLLLLEEDQSVDLVLDGVLGDNALLDLLTANQGGDDAGTDDEGQHEAVHAVPVRSTAGSGSASIVVVQEGEGQELADQGVLHGEQQSGPGNGRGNDTGGVTAVAELTTVASPLKTPVDGTEEGEDL